MVRRSFEQRISHSAREGEDKQRGAGCPSRALNRIDALLRLTVASAGKWSVAPALGTSFRLAKNMALYVCVVPPLCGVLLRTHWRSMLEISLFPLGSIVDRVRMKSYGSCEEYELMWLVDEDVDS